MAGALLMVKVRKSVQKGGPMCAFRLFYGVPLSEYALYKDHVKPGSPKNGDQVVALPEVEEHRSAPAAPASGVGPPPAGVEKVTPFMQ